MTDSLVPPPIQDSLGSVIRSIEALITAKREEQARIRAQLDQMEPEISRLEAGLKALKGEGGAKRSTKGRKLNLTPEDRAARGERAKRLHPTETEVQEN